VYGVCASVRVHVCICVYVYVYVCVFITSVPEVSGSRLAEGSGVSVPRHLMFV
jgi:hypothetical protein